MNLFVEESKNREKKRCAAVFTAHLFCFILLTQFPIMLVEQHTKENRFFTIERKGGAVCPEGRFCYIKGKVKRDEEVV